MRTFVINGEPSLSLSLWYARYSSLRYPESFVCPLLFAGETTPTPQASVLVFTARPTPVRISRKPPRFTFVNTSDAFPLSFSLSPFAYTVNPSAIDPLLMNDVVLPVTPICARDYAHSSINQLAKFVSL